MRLSLTTRQFRRNIETALADINAYLLLLEQWSLNPQDIDSYQKKRVGRMLGSDIRYLIKVSRYTPGFFIVDDELKSTMNRLQILSLRCPELDPYLPKLPGIFI